MSTATLPVTGETVEFPYPFVLEGYVRHDQDEDGWSETKVDSWRPGVHVEPYGIEDQRAIAEAMGAQILTVVGVFKPGRFPVRVFYTRQWRDPNGKTFGKSKCHVTSIYGWRNLVKGYRHEYWLNGKRYNCPWDRIEAAIDDVFGTAEVIHRAEEAATGRKEQ